MISTLSPWEVFLDRVANKLDEKAGARKGDEVLRKIAKFWSLHTGLALTARDVCVMMALLKVARLSNDLEDEDSWLDLAGYAALGSDTVDNDY